MTLIQVSVIFAMWETAKAIIGRDRMNNVKGCPEVAVMILMFEIPYMAWGIWLLFHDLIGTVLIWGLTMISLVLYFIDKEFEGRFQPFNCVLSAMILLGIFAGKI